MLVSLKRPIMTEVGFFKPDPGGTVLPDSLVDKLPRDAKIIEGPDNSNPVDDPVREVRKSSFSETMKKDAKTSLKGKPLSAAEVSAPEKPKAVPKKTILAKD